MSDIPNYLADALAGMLRTERHAVCRAAAEKRDRAAEAPHPALAAMWQAIALTAAEVDDAEKDFLASLTAGPS